jgi:hypothetical protein
MTTTELHQIIDKVLPKMTIQSQVLIAPIHRAIMQDFPNIDGKDAGILEFVMRKMLDEKLVKVDERYGFGDTIQPEGSITSLGKEIIDTGGWLKFLERRSVDEGNAKKLTKLSIEQLEGNIFQIKWWWVIALIGAILGKVIDLLYDAIVIRILQ